MKFFIKKTIFIFLLTFIPFVSFADGTVSFSGNPNIAFSGGTTTVSGELVRQGLSENDYYLLFKVFPGTTAPTSDQIDNVGSWGTLSTDSISPTASVYSANIGMTLNAGSQYQFVFRLLPNGDQITFTPVTITMPLTTPGTAPAEGGPEVDCEGCSLDLTSGEENVVPWPTQAIDNPLAVSDLNSFIVGLLNALLKIGIPVMTVFLVYSGLRLVIARGNEKELIDAKKNLLWVIIGSAILLGAWTLVRALKGTFDQIDLAYITSLIDYIV